MSKNRDYFIENLSILVDSGMDILSAITSLKTEIKEPQLKKLVVTMAEEIEEGSSLWRVLKKHKFLSAADIALIRVGEASGQLGKNLHLISLQHQKERNFKSKIRSAMMYPILVLTLSMFVGIGIAWFILPKLAGVFKDLDIELPLITKILINFGIFLENYGTIAIPLFVLLTFGGIYFVFIFSKTKFIGQYIIFHTPVIKKLIQEVEIARFGYILGTLLKAGIPILDAIESLTDATGMYCYKKFYLQLKENIQEGISFTDSFKKYKKSSQLVPNFIQQLISTGEKSGHLAETCLKIAKTYEEKNEITAKNLTILLEPILLIIIWLGVLTVALAVILPIYSLIGGLNT